MIAIYVLWMPSHKKAMEMQTTAQRDDLEWASDREAEAIDDENSGFLGAYFAVITRVKEAQRIARERESER
jgi:hypothetical protein